MDRYFRRVSWHMEYWIPTNEDVLDINARSIISDVRALVSGTLIPRNLGNIAETWREHHQCPVRLRKMDSDERRAKGQRRITDRRTFDARVNKMARILESTGMSPLDANIKAIELLTFVKKED